MRNTGLEEAEAEIKIAGRNINNLRYADDTTLMAESEEELKILLMKMKEEEDGCADTTQGPLGAPWVTRRSPANSHVCHCVWLSRPLQTPQRTP